MADATANTTGPTTIRGTHGELIDIGPRCWQCGRMLAERCARPWEIRCSRCHARCMNPREEDDLLTPDGSPATVSEIESTG